MGWLVDARSRKTWLYDPQYNAQPVVVDARDARFPLCYTPPNKHAPHTVHESIHTGHPVCWEETAERGICDLLEGRVSVSANLGESVSRPAANRHGMDGLARVIILFYGCYTTPELLWSPLVPSLGRWLLASMMAFPEHGSVELEIERKHWV